MTLSTSAVAVCCCSDCAQFAEQPRVLDGDDSLGGEVLHQLDLLVGERTNLLAVNEIAPINSFSLSMGTRERSCAADFDGATRMRFAFEIGRLRATSAMWTRLVSFSATEAGAGPAESGPALHALGIRGGAPMRRHDAKRRRFGSNRLPNLASQIRTAFASMAWNTGSRSPGDELMTLSTSDVAVCCSSDCAQLVEQPRVLDGDDGLGGEILHKSSICLSVNGTDFSAIDENCADQYVIL